MVALTVVLIHMWMMRIRRGHVDLERIGIQCDDYSWRGRRFRLRHRPEIRPIVVLITHYGHF